MMLINRPWLGRKSPPWQTARRPDRTGATSKTGHPNSLSCPPIRAQLKLQSPDGKHYRNRFSQTPKSLFRSIQSIPRKAEPFKRWFANVSYERVQGIEDPELAQKRVKETHNQK
ncbi:MAG: hypothetical protein C5S48_01285 [Candidatus Methanogaster sp.]|nr:MAG: hypothetical protein C5S48_01285 [ANME-2 cluster archaeon]